MSSKWLTGYKARYPSPAVRTISNVQSQRFLRGRQKYQMTAVSSHRAVSGQANSPAPLLHILETCLYVKSAPKAAEFYANAFGVKPAFVTDRMANIPLGNTTLLLFALDQTGEDIKSEAGMIPHHGPTSDILELLQRQEGGTAGKFKQHFCFAVEKPEDVDDWETRLREKGVNILSTMKWQKGGKSIYFTDEDGNIGEVGSRGIWPHW